MLTLNDFTLKLDGTFFTTYRTSDLIDSFSEADEADKKALSERLEFLENAAHDSDFDEKIKLRSMLNS